jgi:hypothetical protein
MQASLMEEEEEEGRYNIIPCTHTKKAYEM